MDAFNDVLRGGFGAFEYEEPIEVTWKHSEKSKIDLSWKEAIKFTELKLEKRHFSNKEVVKSDLALAGDGKGQTLLK